MHESIKEIAQALGYSYKQSKEEILTGVSFDSRSVKPGDLFVALVGEKTDGHKYLKQAVEKGASGLVISKPEEVNLDDYSDYILVEDGTLFLQKMAHWLCEKTNVPIVAVTGSCGKTSTKDFLATLLSSLGPIVVTSGNHNNELGVPLTISELNPDTKVMVLEMGMRGLGQIDFLCKMAQPDCGIITNIGKTHCELLGSQENIAKAKCELLPYIKENSIIALNKNDESFVTPWLPTCKGKVVWYSSEDSSADYWADQISQGEEGITYRLHWNGKEQEIMLPVQGIHNVSNSLAAIAVAHHLGVKWEDIGTCLKKAALTGMRLDTTVSKDGITIINDAYNANPDSMKSALSVLMNRKGNRKVAVLGDMYELGRYEEESHREVGVAAADMKVDYVVAVGKLGKLIGDEASKRGVQVDWADDNQKAIEYLVKYLNSGDVMLVKGSRGMQMEEIVQKFMG